MDLLPKSHTDFGTKDYWNNFFKKRGKKAFEWYGEYPELCVQLHKYIKPRDNILVVGCGNSNLSTDLYDVGFKQITNIDISQVVIKQMESGNKIIRPEMKWIAMDATNMHFENEDFSVVLDKGTLDALMTEDSDNVQITVSNYFDEISRVLRNAGRYVCVSLLQEHILNKLTDYFPNNNFMFRIIRCIEAEQKTAETSNDGTAMPVFVIIATKFKLLPTKIIELCLAGEKIERFENLDDFKSALLSVQRAAIVCNGLVRSTIDNKEEVSIDLYRPAEKIPRYTIYILDHKKSVHLIGKFAAFIVPQGRETEWLFSTPEGRQKLLTSAQYERLAIVSMHRDQIYTTWDAVKDEISGSILSLAPAGLKHQKIPYISLGSEVGKREIIFKGHSNYSGDYIVEEIIGDDNKTLRRLIFLNNQFAVQSEALVKLVRSKKNKNEFIKSIDQGYLACKHHLYMTLGTHYAMQANSLETDPEILVIGLGGGGLCSYIQLCLKDLIINAVDIDEAMIEVATKYFGLNTDKININIMDGLEYIANSIKMGKKYVALLFDVDSKDSSLGISCPPKSFLEKDILENVKKCLYDNGVFILNLVCRDEKLHDQLIEDLKRSFISVVSYKIEEDINEIIYCYNNIDVNVETHATKLKELMKKCGTQLNALSKKYKLSQDNIIDIEEFINELKM